MSLFHCPLCKGHGYVDMECEKLHHVEPQEVRWSRKKSLIVLGGLALLMAASALLALLVGCNNADPDLYLGDELGGLGSVAEQPADGD